jgi:biotin operon repressor
MEVDMWYKASELADVLGVRETRTKALLRALVEEGVLVDNGAIKGRRYKKKLNIDNANVK